MIGRKKTRAKPRQAKTPTRPVPRNKPIIRRGLNPTPPEITAVVADCHDLGQCGRALAQAFPEWSEAQRLDALREYVRNLQIRWLNSPGRIARERLARRNDAQHTLDYADDADDDEAE